MISFNNLCSSSGNQQGCSNIPKPVVYGGVGYFSGIAVGTLGGLIAKLAGNAEPEVVEFSASLGGGVGALIGIGVGARASMNNSQPAESPEPRPTHLPHYPELEMEPEPEEPEASQANREIV